MLLRVSASEDSYAQRLHSLQTARWKQVLDVQRPYRRNLQRICQGQVLEVGCGIGRNLRNLDGRILGVDVDRSSVAIAQEQGLNAQNVDDFLATQEQQPQLFGTLLLSHVLEHLSEQDARAVMSTYLQWLQPGGVVVVECPQERGYKSDYTHIRWMGFAEITELLSEFGITITSQYSFPFPRWLGSAFLYNEFVVVGHTAAP